MRILWVSNAPWCGTGYGVQTKLILKQLQERGHEVAMFAFYGLEGGRIEYDGYEVWPGSPFDAWGNDVIKAHIHNSRAEAVVTLLDPFVLDQTIWNSLPVPWIGWVPIDSDDVGYHTLDRVKLMNYPIAMSYHGMQQMEKRGVPVAQMIYHAVDTDVMQPLDKDACREELGMGEDKDAFIIGMVMANKGDRKQYPRHFAAIRKFMDSHPDEKIKVFIHTDKTDKMGGWDFDLLIKKFGLNDQVYVTGQYFASIVPVGPELLAQMYSSMDVLMNCSAGEGFGVPIVEAQACGVPVIAHNVTSMPEIVHNGYLVESDLQYLAAHWGFQYCPDIDDMAYRLECVYRNGRGNWLQARQWVVNNLSVNRIGAEWDEVLREIDERSGTNAGQAETPSGDEGTDGQEPVSAGELH